MKRLFEVRGKYFDNKMAAKTYRNANSGKVSKGPDHKDYNKEKKTHHKSRDAK